MRTELTEIVLVVDRSGSMELCKEDAQGGINHFLAEQRDAPGEARLTLVEFDDEYEVVHDGLPIAEVPYYFLDPRGFTALLDAVGKAITTTSERLSALEEQPGLITCVIVTDGEENSSREYKLPQIKQLIEQKEKDGWKFLFLGAGPDAFKQGGSMGISPDAVAQYGEDKSLHAYAASSSVVRQMRAQTMAGQEAEATFTSEARAEIA